MCGAPGAGKSTVCDPIWGPHDVQFGEELPPKEWHDFLNEISRLFALIREHPTLVAAVRMNRRSVRKMTAVAQLPQDGLPYIQTGFVQRALGFGWRMVDLGIDLNELRPFFERMPTSIGVAVCRAPVDVVEQRNKDREKVKATAHENRSHMVLKMQPAIDIAVEVMNERGVPIIELDTTLPIDGTRAALIDFANEKPDNPTAFRFDGQVPVLSPPLWW